MNNLVCFVIFCSLILGLESQCGSGTCCFFSAMNGAICSRQSAMACTHNTVGGNCGTVGIGCNGRGTVTSSSGTCTGSSCTGTACTCNVAGWSGTFCQTPRCYGILGTSGTVCSSRGTCVAPDVCSS